MPEVKFKEKNSKWFKLYKFWSKPYNTDKAMFKKLP